MTVTPTASTAPTTTRELFALILRRMLVVTVAVTVLAAVAGWLLAQSSGLWGAFIGGGIGLLFCGTTVASMVLGDGKSPQFLAVVVLGGWLAKMILILIVLVVIRNLTFYDKYVLAATLGAIVIASLAVEVLAIKSARIPVVDTTPASQDVPPAS
ncbi:hypothetical protein [Salana multivorans]